MNTMNNQHLRNMAQVIYNDNLTPSAGQRTHLAHAVRTGAVTESTIEAALETAISLSGYDVPMATRAVSLALTNTTQLPTTAQNVDTVIHSAINLLDEANVFMNTYYNSAFYTVQNFTTNLNTEALFRINPQFLQLINYQGELHRFYLTVPEATNALQNLDRHTSNLHSNSLENTVDDVQTYIASQMSIVYTLNHEAVAALQDDVFVSARSSRNQFALAQSVEQLAMFRLATQSVPEQFCFEFNASASGRIHAASAFYHQNHHGLSDCYEVVNQIRL